MMLRGQVLVSPPPTQATAPRYAVVMTGGLAVGLLSGAVGVGGGFLIVPILVLVARVPMAQAVGTSLAVIAVNALTGFARYHAVLDEKSIELDWATLALIAVVGICGSVVGHRLGRKLPQQKLPGYSAACSLRLAPQSSPTWRCG